MIRSAILNAFLAMLFLMGGAGPGFGAPLLDVQVSPPPAGPWSPLMNFVSIDEAALRLALESGFAADMAAFGLMPVSPSQHWLTAVKVNEYGELVSVVANSVLHGREISGFERDLFCESRWQRSGGIWNSLGLRSLSIPGGGSAAASAGTCGILSKLHPARDAVFLKENWFPHGGTVHRKTFERLYGRFENELVELSIYNPSWTRDAWMLRAAVDSDLHVRRVLIFASALLDRYSLSVEKRADCHGEAYWNEISGWDALSQTSCRTQVYRFVKSCLTDKEVSCQWDWVPCEGNSCTEEIQLCEKDPLAPACKP